MPYAAQEIARLTELRRKINSLILTIDIHVTNHRAENMWEERLVVCTQNYRARLEGLNRSIVREIDAIRVNKSLVEQPGFGERLEQES